MSARAKNRNIELLEEVRQRVWSIYEGESDIYTVGHNTIIAVSFGCEMERLKIVISHKKLKLTGRLVHQVSMYPGPKPAREYREFVYEDQQFDTIDQMIKEIEIPTIKPHTFLHVDN